MLFTSGKSSNSNLTQKVYDFFIETYEIDSDVEVFHTNLSEDNAFGFTEVNGEEQFIQIHNKLTSKDYIITLLHELVHVVQNERGEYDDEKREKEAYELENILYTKFLKLQQNKSYSPPKCTSCMNDTTYNEILKVWNNETPDDFAIFSELYYQMFGEDFEIPYTTESTTSSFFPYN